MATFGAPRYRAVMTSSPHRHSPRLALGVTLTVLAASLLTGCASSAGNQSKFVGTWGTPDAAGSPSLVLSADGSLSGTDGCNRLAGSWQESNGVLTFPNMASTMMFCVDVDTWLSRAKSAMLKGDNALEFSDTSSVEIGSLPRN
jgi:heat shock protein HslJ